MKTWDGSQFWLVLAVIVQGSQTGTEINNISLVGCWMGSSAGVICLGCDAILLVREASTSPFLCCQSGSFAGGKPSSSLNVSEASREEDASFSHDINANAVNQSSLCTAFFN